ncbi:MAG: YceD family protein [Nevskia sp.]|nr:YceD family protein [Nevskia sp.]
MKDGIPLRVKASAAVTRGSAWQGSIPVAKLPRLAASLADREGELAVQLQAGRDEAGAAQLRGRISGGLGLVCQSCMKAFRWPLEIELELRLVGSEAEEKRLLHECEPWVAEDDSLQLHAVVEEEALLALPLAPRCPDCGSKNE